jgi:hypothetical protein
VDGSEHVVVGEKVVKALDRPAEPSNRARIAVSSVGG